MARERVIYYQDPLQDDFAGNHIKTREVGADFPYQHGHLWGLTGSLLYYLVAIPIVWVISKVHLGLRVENRKALRALRKTGFFLYGNHTQYLDAFLPAMAAFPQRTAILANPDAVSLPFLRNIVQMLGAFPIPTKLSGMRPFLKTLSEFCRDGRCIAIFPEAHIWPYYTGIRPFTDVSFHYPVTENAPSVAMVTTYRRRRGLFRFCKRPAMTVTLSEPFYPRQDVSQKEARAILRDEVFAFMEKTAAEKDSVVYIRYEPAEKM